MKWLIGLLIAGVIGYGYMDYQERQTMREFNLLMLSHEWAEASGEDAEWLHVMVLKGATDAEIVEYADKHRLRCPTWAK